MKQEGFVTINIKKQSSSIRSILFKKFEIILAIDWYPAKKKIFNMILSDIEIDNKGDATLHLRRLNIVSWWPGRDIQLWAIKKAFKSQS